MPVGGSGKEMGAGSSVTGIVEGIVASLLFEGGVRVAAAITEWLRLPAELKRAADAVNRRTESTLDEPTIRRFLGRSDFVELLEQGPDAAAAALLEEAVAAGQSVPDPAASLLALLTALSLSDTRLAEKAFHGAALHALDEVAVGLSYMLFELLVPILQVRDVLVPDERERDRLLLLRLAEAERHAVGLFEALGVEPDLAHELATDLGVGPHVEVVSGVVVVQAARAGTGKSLCAIRTFELGLVDAVVGSAAPIPVLVHAGAFDPRGLRQTVMDECMGIGNPTTLGARIIVDGLDEVPRSAAAQIIAEAGVLVGAWPATSATCFGRPDIEYRGAAVQHLPVPSRQELESLARRISGRPYPFHALPTSVQEAVQLPLFAIGVAAIEARLGTVPTSQAGIIRSLVQNRIGDLEVLENGQLYETLAVRQIRDGSVAEIDIGSAIADELCASRLVVRDDRGYVRFAVPLYGDWFAANALLRDPDLMGTGHLDPTTFDRWRYAVSLAFSIGSADDADRLAQKVAEMAPAGLALVVDDATAPVPNGGGYEALEPSLRSAAGRIQLAGAVVETCVADALTVLGTEAIDTSNVKAETAGRSLSIRYSSIGQSRSRTSMTFLVGTDPSWPYSAAIELFQEQLEQIIEAQLLTPEHDVVDAENTWALARFVTGERSLTHRPIDPNRVLAEIGDVLPDGATPTRFGRGRYKFAMAKTAYDRAIALVRQAAADGRELTRPWPIPDRDFGPFADDLYSGHVAGQMLRDVFSAAIEIYGLVVTTYFPAMAPLLATHATLPAMVRLVYEPRSTGKFTAGVFEEWIPVPVSEAARVVVAVSSYCDGMARLLKRPRDPWHGTGRTPQPFSRAYWASNGVQEFLHADRPAIQQALRWLVDDLVSLGWVGRSSIRF